jgi:acetyl esterase/lipase
MPHPSKVRATPGTTWTASHAAWLPRLVAMTIVLAGGDRASAGWPPQVETVTFRSPAGGPEQKTLLSVPPGDTPVPLLVAFHTWSGDYLQDEGPYAEWCLARGWAFLHPDLRGPANRPDAAGSELAFADLEAALDLVRSRRRIDPDRIYAVGVSGGGMMALLAAARMPDVWAAASAWVPVTDLAAWHVDSIARKNKYAAEIEQVCGGPPGSSATVDAAYATRSVLARLGAAEIPFPLDINTGIHDGYEGSVPVSHAIRAFNVVAEVADRIPEATIEALVRERAVPPALAFEGSDPLYESRPVLLRRTSGGSRLTIFDGGHEILHEAALSWLEAQRRAAPPTWRVPPHVPPILARPAAASGK